MSALRRLTVAFAGLALAFATAMAAAAQPAQKDQPGGANVVRSILPDFMPSLPMATVIRNTWNSSP